MQRRSVFLGLVLLAGILLIGAFFISQAPAEASRMVSVLPTPLSPHPPPPSTFIPPAQLLKQSPPTHVGGVPAIHHTGSGQVTADDVKAFTAVHGFLGVAHGKTDAGTIPTIAKLQLLTASQASAALGGENIDRAGSAAVWYVELAGPFTFVLSVPSATKSVTVKNGIEIFDATTGDLILFGTNG